MKPTKKIQLEIYPDKEQEFYFSLMKYKLSPEPDDKDLKTIVDAIHFDNETFANSFELSQTQEQKIKDKLLDIHTYLLQSKKYSGDYFKISKKNFEEFLQSPLGKRLNEFFFILEITRQWIGKEKSAEVKATAATLSWVVSAFMQTLSQSTGKSMTGAINAGIAMQELQGKEIKVSSGKKGNLLYQLEDDEDAIEVEVFIEKQGQIRKKQHTSDLKNDPDLEDINSIFMKVKEEVIQLKESGNYLECSYYKNAKVKNKLLDLSEAILTETISVPGENIEKNITVTKEGDYIFNPKQPISVNSGKSTEPVIYNYEEILREESIKKDKKSAIQSTASIFTLFDAHITRFLKLTRDNPEKIQARDRIIIDIYKLLKECLPKLSLHVYTTTTGYIASRMELLDTEKQHDETSRKQPYRKYLRDNVYNILKSHNAI